MQGSSFLHHASQANDFISWIRSKTQVIGLIKQICESRNEPPLSVIRPVPTRWTAFYCAYKRLLRLRHTLKMILGADRMRTTDDQMVFQGTRQAKEKAN